MSVQEPNYPTEYRGNKIYDETKVKNLNPDEKPNLRLLTGRMEIDHVLESIGVDHDPESIVLEDSYNCLWIDTKGGEYTEVWGIHKSTPYLDRVAVRLK